MGLGLFKLENINTTLNNTIIVFQEVYKFAYGDEEEIKDDPDPVHEALGVLIGNIIGTKQIVENAIEIEKEKAKSRGGDAPKGVGEMVALSSHHRNKT
jgi:hypothetical protein